MSINTKYAEYCNHPLFEEWMLEIWDWVDNHDISNNSIPYDPKQLLELESLDLSYGKSIKGIMENNEVVGEIIRESTKPLPAAIGNLKKLKYLRIIGFDELPKEIAELDNLETLVCLRCSFKQFPKALCGLKNLKSLNILCKSLETLPDEFGNLSSLTTFDMRGSQIEYLPQSIGNLTNLEVFQLAANKKLKALPDSIGKLTTLKVLEIRASNLTTLPESIGNLTQLKLLGLYANNLNDLPNSITNLKALKLLDVRENPLSNLSEASKQFLADLGDKLYTQPAETTTRFPAHFIM
ncbi:leucine-rich repeat domain-containing protein [Psychrobacter sanguinis]|uniref:leucine-rich repeat domain-containing protein n=1 Tax=Psychrobacter sanguinis TaxID=861445 RepID=UPI001918A4A6|nr:leucine-rich repeat domain-containing protein [Psychrobacter sanguinis]MCC3308303.1 leucine-rich repeat domain-containing protein [Psychrobacter sanguinis]UEC25612.1 leucine-rich repeat domain-containing protein [Psychrobacter sanguinis]